MCVNSQNTMGKIIDLTKSYKFTAARDLNDFYPLSMINYLKQFFGRQSIIVVKSFEN